MTPSPVSTKAVVETPVVDVTALTHRYGRRVALDDLSLRLEPGVTALIGVNGAGKSTLMSCLSGARRPKSGQVKVAGHDPYAWRDRRRALARVSSMPQTARFPGGMTALEVVEYLTWMRGVPARTARARARRALDRVLLGDRADTKVKHLSGGMVRRIALAQAIAAEPAVLLLDEPSTGLDPEQRRTMVELIAQIDRELETTVLLSSHVMEDVTDVAARVVVLDAGRIVFTGSVAQLSQQAPTGTPSSRAPEAGFLAIVSQSRPTA